MRRILDLPFLVILMGIGALGAGARPVVQDPTFGVRLLNLSARWGAVFAVQGDIQHTGTELLQQFGLQDEALLHARGRAAVVVTHRQHPGARLGT